MNHSLLFHGKRICFISAHPDDIELGAGALIAHIGDQAKIRCVTLSDNQKNPDLKNVVDEHYRSMAALGVKEEDIVVGTFETRRFPHARQEILEYLIGLNRTFEPDIVFVHTRADTHQDHVTTVEEALRAFRGTTVLGFDVLRSSYGFFFEFSGRSVRGRHRAKNPCPGAIQNLRQQVLFRPPHHPCHTGATRRSRRASFR